MRHKILKFGVTKGFKNTMLVRVFRPEMGYTSVLDLKQKQIKLLVINYLQNNHLKAKTLVPCPVNPL